MHVPDSAVSPATSAVFGAAMAPVWYAAGRRVRATLATRRVPLLALGAAYSFTLMMFNLPVPGGTTAHATGAVLLAIALGPWAASLALTVTLAIQALFFADGGLLALGVDCFAMAFAMPFVGWAVYRAIAAGAPPGSARRTLGAGLGAWAGLGAAALVTALALGVQPLLERGADGRALYFPFGLGVTLPAMLLPHLTLIGAAEALFTVLALRALEAARVPLADDAGRTSGGGRLDGLLAGLGALVALAPLGLLARGAGWGEWNPDELARRAGYLPRALAAAEAHRLPSLLPGYLAGRGPLAYALAGLAGAALATLLSLAIGRALSRRPAVPPRPAPARPAGGPGTLPAWLRGPSEPAPVAASARRRGHAEAGARTLAGLADGLHGVLATERRARGPGLLQGLDARVKLVTLAACVTLTCLQRAPGPVLALLALALLLGAASRVPPGLLLGRFGLAVGLLSLAVTLPAAFGFVTPGPALLVLWRGPDVAVTAPGLARVGFYALRAAAAACFGALLALTTPWPALLAGLRGLRAPRLFVDVLGMTWRYFAVLLRSAAEMFTARRSRAVGAATAAVERRAVAGGAAALLGRTLAFADEVHAAMRARGWTGESRALAVPRARGADLAWAAGMAAVLAAIALWGRLGWPGR